jgi:hypothetical protein
VAQLRKESADPETAVLRWVASRGLAMMALLGISPLSDAEQERLFARLTDDAAWIPRAQNKKR